jgi:hypothetical protein
MKILIFEFLKRMASNLSVSPKVILFPCRPKVTELPIKHVKEIDVIDLETQYRQLLRVNWDQIFVNGIPRDTLEFWQTASTLKKCSR